MDIKSAKEEIKNAMKAYFTKNDFGEYVIPVEKQRPIFLMGAPGIGKTAIMEQIAAELGVGLISYSMTHHTRQSALGLPFITSKNYGGKEYSVSEYTMSEIIASVYDMMEETGKTEGILFLDEINCVSETLAPSMLQFLQYKVFGRHRVPDGWIVVTAGNPPEYNNSVREFDIVTWDRLKRIDVEANYEIWKQYALNSGTHPAVLSYLDVKPGDFYKIESSVDGKRFVTARGWSDLSAMISLYEKNGIPVSKSLIQQYIQHPQVAKEFAIYYDLFVKYKSNYQIGDILAGKSSQSIALRAKNAKFDERLAVLSLILDAIITKTAEVYRTANSLSKILNTIKDFRLMTRVDSDVAAFLKTRKADLEKELQAGIRSSSLSEFDRSVIRTTMSYLDEMLDVLLKKRPTTTLESFKSLKEDYDSKLAAHKKKGEIVREELNNAFKFIEDAFGEGQEMVIFCGELTVSTPCAWFVSQFGCEKYFNHNKNLLFYEREKELKDEINSLLLEEPEEE